MHVNLHIFYVIQGNTHKAVNKVIAQETSDYMGGYKI